ncbi:VENN motif pre-toxin domain-containing protein [Avibacterium sp. 20-15]|uniref:VENN motif pre-toxin domain-containing protein n=1 Tax=unclassified Avibacterium TaxID=2685287 RepID=UPI0020276ADB|nr:MULTISPECIES: VENN motif pre-toxin domain-containing protein [unclassified Avibacterium]MCW9732234.1 VENN motif pre-toxin domain-containing protein [Avibacterium sp. 20-15]URL04405.1 VENN motif pre-toxin domain-containing protein [Avibacterium sp. 20-132]
MAGQSGAQIATTLASPSLNEKIKALTTDSNGEVNVLTNTLAHAMLGAVEAAAAKGNITAGAVAASASELAAPAITKLLGKDNPNQLSTEERQTVTALSTFAGSLASGLMAQQNGSATNTVSTLNAAALGGEIGKRAVENNYLYAFEAERKAELDILIQTEADPEKRKAYEAERAAIIKRDIDRQQAIEASCQRFNKGSAGCASQIAEANRAKASYSTSTDLIRGVGMQRDKRRYSELFSSDFARVNEALQGKDPVTVQKEAFAIEVSKAKNTRPEDEYTWISNGIDLGWLGEYQGWGRAIKGLPKSGNFATKVPKEVNANGKLSVNGDSFGYKTTETYFRVEGGGINNKTSQNRISVNQDGSISINSGCQGQLCVSTGSSNHAMYYLTERWQNGKVVVFEVNKTLHDEIIKSAIPQKPIPGIPRDPNAPKIVDERKGSPSINLELPKVWDRLLEKHSSKGRVLTEEQFKNEFGK